MDGQMDGWMEKNKQKPQTIECSGPMRLHGNDFSRLKRIRWKLERTRLCRAGLSLGVRHLG